MTGQDTSPYIKGMARKKPRQDFIHNLMMGNEYRACITLLGLSQAEGADFIGVHTRTGRRFARSEAPVNPTAAKLLRLAVHHRLSPADIDAAQGEVKKGPGNRRPKTINTIDLNDDQLRVAMTGLNDRERRILEARRLAEEPITLRALSAEFGISKERVRQIEADAVTKITAAAAPAPQVSA